MLEAPVQAQLIESFANTLDVELETDELETPEALSAWLGTQGLLDAGHLVDAEDHALCLRLRLGIREELGVNVGDRADTALLAGAGEALSALPLFVSLPGREGTAALRPSPGLAPGRKALAELAIAWSVLTITGEVARLKRCAEHTCAWVFWDTSKNRSRRWCSMRVCGNRAKARRYSAKQAAGASTGRST